MLWYDIIYTYMYTHIYWLILRQRWVCGRWVTNQLEPWDMMGMTSRNWEVMFTYFIIYIYDMYNICSGRYIYILGYMDNYSEDRDGDDTAWSSWQKGMKLVIPRSCYMTETTSTYRKSFSRNHHKSPLGDDGDDDRLRISGWHGFGPRTCKQHHRNTRWCPSSLAKLVNITPITMVYGRYSYS